MPDKKVGKWFWLDEGWGGGIALYTLNPDACQKWFAGLDAKILLGAARFLQELTNLMSTPTTTLAG